MERVVVYTFCVAWIVILCLCVWALVDPKGYSRRFKFGLFPLNDTNQAVRLKYVRLTAILILAMAAVLVVAARR